MVDSIVVQHQDNPHPCTLRSVVLADVVEQQTKSGTVLPVTAMSQDLARHPVHRAEAIPFLVLARGGDLPLPPAPGPTPEYAGQQVEVNFISEQQLDGASFSLRDIARKLCDFRDEVGIGAPHMQHRTHDPIPQAVELPTDRFTTDDQLHAFSEVPR